MLSLNSGKLCNLGSFRGKTAKRGIAEKTKAADSVSVFSGDTCTRQSTADHSDKMVGVRGFEPPASSSRSTIENYISDSMNEVTNKSEINCIGPNKQSNTDIPNDELESLAKLLRNLNKNQRAKLMMLLLEEEE